MSPKYREKKLKKSKEKTKDVNEEIPKSTNQNVKDMLSLMESIDEERWEQGEKEKEKYEEILEKTEKVQKETLKEEKREQEKTKLSWADYKKKIDNLKAQKQEFFTNENYSEAIEVSKQIIDLATKAGMKITIQQEEKSIVLMQDAIEKSSQKSIILEKIKGLKNVKHGFYVKGDYGEAIKITKKIIELARKINMTQIVNEQENFIDVIDNKAEETPSKDNIVERLEGLEAVKLGHYINEDFKSAIKVAQKILDMAEKSELEEVVIEQKKFIDFMQSKFEKEPSKIEIVEKIEGLKNIKQGHVVKGEFEKAIKICHKIINFAETAKIHSIVEEEENSINEMQQKIDKEENYSKIQEECKKLDEIFDMFVEDGEIVEAHKLIEDFKKKYSNIVYFFFTSIPGVEELIEKDRKVWLRHKVKQDYIDVEIEKEDIIDVDARTQIAQKIEKSIVKERETIIEEEPASISVEKNIELEKARLEEEKARLRLGTLKLEKEKERFEIENKRLDLEKAELEEKAAKLELGRLKLEKEMDQFEKNKLELEEQKVKLSEEREAIERSKEETREEEAKLELERASLKEERASLKLEKAKIERQKTKLELQKKELDEKKAS